LDDLETAQEAFGKEVTNACWSFFVWKHINNIASNDDVVLKALNENALSWKVITHSLQCTFLITLGRLFDNDGRSLTADTFLKLCMANIDQFGGEHLKARKLASMNGSDPDWLNDYVRDAYQPTEEDLRSLRAQVLEQKNAYDEVYAPIRNKVMAHKDWDTIEQVNELFEKTNISQIQQMLGFLHQIEKIIWDLLYNGKLNEVGHYVFDEEELVQADVEALLGRLMP
jgi:hypothetical protein